MPDGYGGSNPPLFTIFLGRVAEWFKAMVLKTIVLRSTVGSNPTPSAIKNDSGVAQLAEQTAVNRLVIGSNPITGAK